MQIIEVRNDILKLAYSPYQNGLLLSDFLLVSEGTKSVLTQVIGMESSAEKDVNIAILKCCLSVDETGKINTYLGFTPSTGAEVAPVSQEQVISMLTDEESPIQWGYLSQHDNTVFKTDKELLKNKPLILLDDYANYNVIANNLVFTNKKLGEKTVLIDFDGSLKIDNAYYIKISEDFKLPLSYNTLNYIYENELKDESLSAQAVVQDVIIELQEYIKTLKEGYLPFSTIKNVIYSQYEENKIPELMLFKNKFVKYSQQDIFAETIEDFNCLNEAISENTVVVIDATEIEPIWHKLVLNYIAKNITIECAFIAKLENDNSDKKTILDIYNNRYLVPILASNYTHTFVNVMKSIAKNMILFPPNQYVNDFATYTSFMNKLNRDEYVICGENTLYLSFLLKLTYVDTNMAPDYIEEEIQKDVDKLYRAGARKESMTIQPQENILEEESFTQDEILTDADLDYLEELDNLPEIEETSINNDAEPDFEPEENLIEEQQIIQTEEIQTAIEEPSIQEETPPVEETDKPIPQPQPIPVYSVPELEYEETADFKEGNFVYHEKYGKGVIEKIMNYGNKTLCSIQFEEIGRRLLDPNLAGLKQI